MLDELLLGGEVQESSKKNVLKAIAAQDLLQEVCIHLYLCVFIMLAMSIVESRKQRSVVCPSVCSVSSGAAVMQPVYVLVLLYEG